jgi:hypothetical protein
MKLKIPVEVDLNGIDGIVDEIKRLQTYKLFEGDDMVLVNLDDVAEILMNHIEAKRKSEPQRMRGKWKGYNGENPDWQRTDGSPVFLICSECGATVVNNFAAKWNYCCVCGADMRGTE